MAQRSEMSSSTCKTASAWRGHPDGADPAASSLEIWPAS